MYTHGKRVREGRGANVYDIHEYLVQVYKRDIPGTVEYVVYTYHRYIPWYVRIYVLSIHAPAVLFHFGICLRPVELPDTDYPAKCSSHLLVARGMLCASSTFYL